MIPSFFTLRGVDLRVGCLGSSPPIPSDGISSRCAQWCILDKSHVCIGFIRFLSPLSGRILNILASHLLVCLEDFIPDYGQHFTSFIKPKHLPSQWLINSSQTSRLIWTTASVTLSPYHTLTPQVSLLSLPTTLSLLHLDSHRHMSCQLWNLTDPTISLTALMRLLARLWVNLCLTLSSRQSRSIFLFPTVPQTRP